MDNKDNEAFEKCWKQFEGEYNNEEDYLSHKAESQGIWQAAIEYKQKEIDELKEKLQASDAVVDFFYESTKKVGW